MQLEKQIQNMDEELIEKENKINNFRSQLSSNKINDKDKINTIIEEHHQEVDRLTTEITQKGEEIIQLNKKYNDLIKITEEKLIKSEKLSDQKLTKLQEDFLKEYESIVKEKETESGKYKDIKTKFDKISLDYSSVKQQKRRDWAKITQNWLKLFHLLLKNSKKVINNVVIE